jgi:hypothetical protein
MQLFNYCESIYPYKNIKLIPKKNSKKSEIVFRQILTSDLYTWLFGDNIFVEN